MSWAVPHRSDGPISSMSDRGVADPDQAGILGGLIRYLEHAAALEFDDMGPC